MSSPFFSTVRRITIASRLCRMMTSVMVMTTSGKRKITKSKCDQNLISPYDTNTISRWEVTRIQKIIKCEIRQIDLKVGVGMKAKKQQNVANFLTFSFSVGLCHHQMNTLVDSCEKNAAISSHQPNMV